MSDSRTEAWNNPKYLIHVDSRCLRKDLNKRVEQRLNDYDANLIKRRNKLTELFAQEEQDLMKEIEDSMQHDEEAMLLDMQIRTKVLKSRREQERLKIVKEKKLQQYINKCVELRPILANQRLQETKKVQQIQIQENQTRRQNEKQIENMWYTILMKDLQEQQHREDQENFNLRKKQWENRAILDMQCKAAELQQENKIREIREDAFKLNNLKEQLRREEIAQLDAKRRKRDQIYTEIMAQIQEKQDKMWQEMEEDRILAKTRMGLVLREVEKEKEINSKERYRREMDQYMDYIARLEQERKDEEHRIDILVAEEREMIQIRQEKARKNYEAARKKLQQFCAQERQKQIEFRRQEAEEQLKLKQAENQLYKLAFDHNERLQAEYQRQQVLAAKQYGDDLKKQIEHKKLIQECEKANLQKILLEGKAQEEEYERYLKEIIGGNVPKTEEHPFKRIVSKDRTPCFKLYY